MYAVEVYTTDEGCIGIKQENYGGDPSVVLFRPDQLELLIQWLHEAKETLKSKAN